MKRPAPLSGPTTRRTLLCLAMSLAILGACSPRARLTRAGDRSGAIERTSPEDTRAAAAALSGASAPQAQRVPAAERYFQKDTGTDDGEFSGMKGGLPMLLFVALLAAAVGVF